MVNPHTPLIEATCVISCLLAQDRRTACTSAQPVRPQRPVNTSELRSYQGGLDMKGTLNQRGSWRYPMAFAMALIVTLSLLGAGTTNGVVSAGAPAGLPPGMQGVSAQ